jgi:hypothetical protein
VAWEPRPVRYINSLEVSLTTENFKQRPTAHALCFRFKMLKVKKRILTSHTKTKKIIVSGLQQQRPSHWWIWKNVFFYFSDSAIGFWHLPGPPHSKLCNYCDKFFSQSAGHGRFSYFPTMTYLKKAKSPPPWGTLSTYVTKIYFHWICLIWNVLHTVPEMRYC